ncbi:MAG: hypothetical protein ACXV5D_08540 [Halobacteriota archaeon]
MSGRKETINVQIDKATHDRLRKLGTKGQTGDTIIQGLIGANQRVSVFIAEMLETVIENVVYQAQQGTYWNSQLDEIREELGMDTGLELDDEDEASKDKIAKRFAKQAVEQMHRGAYGIFLGENEVKITDRIACSGEKE